ncbi:hypothetical protein BDR26DRAFT_869675 [Obelidium mucronatum]|nr:hypothetical protein BDR26DRAFT_869675 [Obelidium mucronatum]
MQDYSPQPESAAFSKECLELRLDMRQTGYILDDENEVKVLLGVSGAGKTRTLLELLYIEFGYYFVSDTRNKDFGSKDFGECMLKCIETPSKTKEYIAILYFVRYFVCNYLLANKYCSKPHEILLAQLHPKMFFGGKDVFCELFISLAETLSHGIYRMYLDDAFGFVAIDEIQETLQGGDVFSLTFKKNRPFFSPLVYYTKHFGLVKKFIVAGTEINFEIMFEFSTTGAMQFSRSATECRMLAPFQSLGKTQVVNYSRWVLTENRILAEDIEAFIDRVSNFSLCFGRARFVAFLIDHFLVHGDIQLAFSAFLKGICNPLSPLFPLRFYQDRVVTSVDRVVNNLDHICSEAIAAFIMKGIAHVPVGNQSAAYACHYGLGLCSLNESGSGIFSLKLTELVVIDCLRYLIPFGDIVLKFAQKMANFPQPQMVGYFLEYVVAFALVANLNPGNEDVLRTICVSNVSVAEYCRSPSEPHVVMLPNNCCGPDIIYNHNGEIYIVQVKFVDTASKQEELDVLHTTDPSRFYWNSKSNCVLKGFEEDRDAILESLKEKTVFRKVFLHAKASATTGLDGNMLINEKVLPQFFDCLNSDMWDFLNRMRESFVAEQSK